MYAPTREIRSLDLMRRCPHNLPRLILPLRGHGRALARVALKRALRVQDCATARESTPALLWRHEPQRPLALRPHARLDARARYRSARVASRRLPQERAYPST